MVKVCHFQTHAGLLPEQLSAGAGSPRAGRSRPWAAAAAAPSDCWALSGAALPGGHRFQVPPRHCLRGGSDGRGRRGEARAAAAVGAAAVAPTSSSGSAQRTRKPPRGARGGQESPSACSVLQYRPGRAGGKSAGTEP